jgi:hypothetical protein
MSEWEVEKQIVNAETKASVKSDGSYTIADLIGRDADESFVDFDLSEVKSLLGNLATSDVPDVSHAENLQREALRCADIISDYLGKITKSISYLENKHNSEKNRIALNYKPEDGSRVSIELRKMAGEADTSLHDLSLKISRAKGAKSALDKKYDIVIKTHHYYKDIAAGYRKVINI